MPQGLLKPVVKVDSTGGPEGAGPGLAGGDGGVGAGRGR